MEVYDLVTRQTSTKEVPEDMITFELVENYGGAVKLVGNMIEVNHLNTPFQEGVIIRAIVKGVGSVDTKLCYSGVVLLDKAVYSYNKNTSDGVKMEVTLNGTEGTPVVKANDRVISNNDYANGTISLNKTELNKMAQGLNQIEVVVGSNKANAVVNVEGVLSAYAEEIAPNTYNIYCADQINDIADRASKGETFAGKTFTVVGEIDMRGAELKQIKKFDGNFVSLSNATIKNFVVNSMVDNNVALFGELTGKIENVAFEGNIEISFPTSAAATYNIALVAVNNGTLNDVKFTGSVIVNTTGIVALNTKMNVAGLVAVNNGTMTGCTVGAETVVDVTVMFDLAGLTINASTLTADEFVAGKVNFNCKAPAGKNGVKFINANIVIRVK